MRSAIETDQLASIGMLIARYRNNISTAEGGDAEHPQQLKSIHKFTRLKR
jgi:hypothetical protein